MGPAPLLHHRLAERTVLGLEFGALEPRLCRSDWPVLFLHWAVPSCKAMCWLQQQLVSGWYHWPPGCGCRWDRGDGAHLLVKDKRQCAQIGKEHFWWDGKILLALTWGAFLPWQRAEIETSRGPFQHNIFCDYLPDWQGITAVDVNADQRWACARSLEAAL